MQSKLALPMPCCLGLFAASLPATAHYLWIEPNKTRHAKLYFGEFQEEVREKAGGGLDEIKAPHAWKLDARGIRRAIEATRARNAFAVYFKKIPLPKAKIMVYAPNLWMQEHHSDENGKVKITTPWPGLYVPEVIHTEKQPGEFQGKKFSAVRHRATLSFNTRIRNHGK